MSQIFPAEASDLEVPHLTEDEIRALPTAGSRKFAASSLPDLQTDFTAEFPYAGKEKQHCAICLDPFQARSFVEKAGENQASEAVTMLRCAHFFHMGRLGCLKVPLSCSQRCVASWMCRPYLRPLLNESCEAAGCPVSLMSSLLRVKLGFRGHLKAYRPET